ncbi:hypothetical protein [Aquabacterium sp. OR-4]|uniref:hypothetical protein n=1 Tax=Aquabacterium sp. OR-4 TaxID=2978127 RepID=UPI0021B1CA16|nr:hypothetical protein [Aquabacterium sp. OR-4]MDT7836287.1 hypothetical protein [Aquabacterium sp. OR-4]
MLDTVLIDGDQAVFVPMFGAALVVVQPGRLRASGPATAGGKKICVDGDESSVSVPGCSYMTPQYCIPGSGTLKIASLAANQKAQHCHTGGKPMLLKGAMFNARFEVQVPAMQPPPGPGAPVPDGSPSYSGQGQFVSTNLKVKAT